MEREKKRVWELFLPLSLGLTLYDLAAENTYFLMEMSLVVLFAAFVIAEKSLLRHPIKEMKLMLREMDSGIRTAFWLMFFYGLWEVLTAVYSPYPKGLAEKYRVVILMAFYSMLILRLSGAVRRKTILRSICFAGFVSAVMSVVRLNAVYGRRLSLRLDYNVFATVLLMGLVAGVFLLGNEPLPPRSLMLWLVISPVIILSSSRRSVIFLVCFAVWQIIESVAAASDKIKCLGEWTLVVFAIFIIVILLQFYIDANYKRFIASAENPPPAETSALERYEAIKQDGGKSKRLIIWSAAVRELDSYSHKEKLFGRGFGYDRYFYQITDDRDLLEAYGAQSRRALSAHCFVLTDLMNGGYIQAFLGVGIWICIGLRILKKFTQNLSEAMLFGFTLGVCFLSSFISNRYGFLYDKYFWIWLCLL